MQQGQRRCSSVERGLDLKKQTKVISEFESLKLQQLLKDYQEVRGVPLKKNFAELGLMRPEESMRFI